MFSSERLKGLDVFVCVAETGSFTAAAERLNVTRSAISKAITRLEARLDTRLFNRTTRRLALTDAGVRFYRTCTNVLGELEEAELSLHAHNTEPMGRVRIDLPAAYGRLHALGVILRCVEAHELLVPHISFSDRYVTRLKRISTSWCALVAQTYGRPPWGGAIWGPNGWFFAPPPRMCSSREHPRLRMIWSTTAA